jgi:hypothetical protein
MLTACGNRPTHLADGGINELQGQIIANKEAVDDNFNDFIEKFSVDSTFQLSRIKFPLKTKLYDLSNDKDSIIYQDRAGFEMMDFSKKKPSGQYVQWEQRIVVEREKARIEIRGIENGIMVDYLFEKISGAWMLIEIDDSST